MRYLDFVREILDSGPRHSSDAMTHVLYVLEHERSELDKVIERVRKLIDEGLSQ